ncbi:MAG: HlyD family efflux transporter periplasmic adaptor subunit [Phycisphaerales bacterium]|nr:HlyD family efflux transporter periplasmic adaptor subunit [Phycisphaerales bacterium]
MTAPPTQPGLADRLKEVVVSVRGDLDISRHNFRAGPGYVIRDPITFASHRFDPEDYLVINAIRGQGTLGEIFEQLVGLDILDAEDVESFYEFVLDLHQRNLLSLPINNADTLYQRYEQRKRAESIGRVMGIFFMKIPVCNPNQLLGRTLPLFGWLFTLPGFLLWCALVTVAGAVVVSRSGDLSSPVLAMLDGNNVFLLVASLIGLKVVHEFGHAFACRAFGGYVPEMGVFLVLFTPLAYVDATDSWGFNKTHQRAIVTLGGVYFESIVGAIAVFVWALTEPSTVNTVAYQVMILSTVTTALFNLNPLLRYDAYYLVSDLAGVPNLRKRCQEAVADFFKRTCFGLKENIDGDPIQPNLALVGFGLAQMGYRGVVMITISTVLVLKFGSVGILLAIVLNGITIVRGLYGIGKYVISSPEVAAVRFRAISLTAGAVVIALSGIGMIPIPHEIDSKGVISFQQVSSIRAPESGTIIELPDEVGSTLSQGELLIALENHDIKSRLESLQADAQTSQNKVRLASLESPAEAIIELYKSEQVLQQYNQLNEQSQALTINATADGRVLDLLIDQEGAFVNRGDPILIYGSGEIEGVIHVRALDFQSATLEVGDELICRSPSHPNQDIVGVVTRIGPVATKDVEPRILQAMPQGLVPMNSATGTVIDSFVEIDLSIRRIDADLIGSELKAKIPAHNITIARFLERRIKRFLNRVKQSASN